MKLNYDLAKKIVADYGFLIGTEYEAGIRVDHIVIVPLNPKLRIRFLKLYDFKTKNQDEAILPLLDCKLTIYVIHIFSKSHIGFHDFFVFLKDHNIPFNSSQYL